MAMSTGDLYRLAGDLAAEHGAAASDYASRAVMTLEAEGNHARAQFWFVMMCCWPISIRAASTPTSAFRSTRPKFPVVR